MTPTMPPPMIPTNAKTSIEARSFLGKVWQLARPYWRSEERGRAWLLLATIVALTLFLVFMEVQFTNWNRDFFDSLQNKQFDTFRSLIIYFCGLATVYIIAAAYATYLTSMLQMRWRAWLTKRYLGDWLDSQTYYRLELEQSGADNPDQRIAEDIRLFTGRTLDLSLGLLSAVVTLASFLGILWTISGPLSFMLGDTEITIPGYMVWAALLYAVVGSLLTYVVGRRLISLNFEKERLEADFRYGLIRLRENAEGIALYRGEAIESRGLHERFDRILGNWWDVIRNTKRLQFMTTGYTQVAIIFPFVVGAPRFFSGVFTLGQLTQVASAFGQVQSALSFFVNNFAGASGLAAWKASVDRLLTFSESLDATRNAQSRDASARIDMPGSSEIISRNLDVALPGGRVILNDAAFRIAPGDRILLTGASGSGKSTLFRTIAGIWPYTHGRIEVPVGARILFLPQRPYLPIGSLHEVIAYPEPASAFDAAAVKDALHATRMAAFDARLDEVQNWSMAMSPGEQQRLTVARALLLRPDWLFLDEATASLDAATEAQLYSAIRDRLPDAAIVSIAHRPNVADYHDRRWTIENSRLSSS